MARNSQVKIDVVADMAMVCRRGAEEFARLAQHAANARGRFTVALSGGSTPKGMFTLLAETPAFRECIPWHVVHFFWGDERHVPPDHVESNYRMAREALLSKVRVPSENVHRIRSECPDPTDAAERSETELRVFFQVPPGTFPTFDLIFLGLGPDAHTASLFPGTQALQERHRWVIANWVEKLNSWRITLTAPAINNCRDVIFLVSGHDKAEAARAILEGPCQPEHYPAQLINPTAGRVDWLLDRPAARLLTNRED